MHAFFLSTGISFIAERGDMSQLMAKQLRPAARRASA
jgi:putative Ca2+/H+ antiporter (TMEM165/GDT1 family)